MKRSWVFLAVIGVLCVVVAFEYNGLVASHIKVEQTIAQVQNVYQRRADLIPNLVEVVKGYASHEKGTFEAVTKARAEATKPTLQLSANMTPAQLQKWQEAQGQLSAALGRLMMLKEAYPDLKANQNFMALQTQLEGTENRIAQERRMWGLAVQYYNTNRRSFPTLIIANMLGFAPEPFFEAEAGAKTAPKVSFK
jgi:LemA protein